MNKNIVNVELKAQWSANIFLCFYAALILLFISSHFSREQGVVWPLLTAQVLPLLVFLPGILKRYYRSYSWFCFLMLLYFVLAVDNSFKSTAMWNDYLLVALTVILFIVAMMASRWQQYAQYQTGSYSEGKEQ